MTYVVCAEGIQYKEEARLQTSSSFNRLVAVQYYFQFIPIVTPIYFCLLSDQETVFFDTQQVSKADSDHPLNSVSIPTFIIHNAIGPLISQAEA